MLAKLSVSRFNHTMENMPSNERIEEINQIDWETRRKLRENMFIERALELQIEINHRTFVDEDSRWAFIHHAITELDQSSPYCGREGKLTGLCDIQYFNEAGIAEMPTREYKDVAVTNRGLTVIFHPDDDNLTEDCYHIGHWLEYVDKAGEHCSTVAPLTGDATDIAYKFTDSDYEDMLRGLLPADIMDMFGKLTAPRSDEALATAIGLLAGMRIDARHIDNETLSDLSDYVWLRLGIRDDMSYMLVTSPDDGSDVPVVEAALIDGIAIGRGIDTTEGKWFFNMKLLTSSNAEGAPVSRRIALESIESLQQLEDDESEDVMT